MTFSQINMAHGFCREARFAEDRSHNIPCRNTHLLADIDVESCLSAGSREGVFGSQDGSLAAELASLRQSAWDRASWLRWFWGSGLCVLDLFPFRCLGVNCSG